MLLITLTHRLSIIFICTQNWGFGGYKGEDVTILCSNPQKASPCVNARLLVCRMSKSVRRSELYRVFQKKVAP